MADAIATSRLSKRFGDVVALDAIDLTVEVGEVFGLLGPNGAGKTTMIRLLLDILRPTAGRARVLGLDPRSDGVEIRRRTGYLPGDFVVGGRQTSRELLTYLANLRDLGTHAPVTRLAERLGLDLDEQIANLSKGNRQKIGLIQAFMHGPELLILDEPTSGLDPLVAREFLVMVDEASHRGQTVLMSSHILSEVQQTADRTAIIREGKLITVDGVDDLRSRAMRHVRITFAEPVPGSAFADVDAIDDLHVDGVDLRCRLVGDADALVKAAARHTVVDVISEEPDLEELFFHHYTGAGHVG